VGAEQALGKWGGGALIGDAQGRELGSLSPVAGGLAGILAPSGLVRGLPAACFQCNLSVAKLQGAIFTIPQLVEQGIQLMPLREEAAGPQGLIRELVLSNYPTEFLRQLPERVEAGADSLALNAYLRLLLRRSLIPRESLPALLALSWVADDLRSAFQRLMEQAGETSSR